MKKYIRASRYSGFIGIWWITDGYFVFGVEKPVDKGVVDGRYIQFSDTANHLNQWKKCIYNEFKGEKADTIYKLGYKGLERGRVIYDTMTQVYVITCSSKIAKDSRAVEAIRKVFNLTDCRVEIEILNHYSKLTLTGDPAVDSQILDMD